MYTGKLLPTFRRSLLSPYSGSKQKELHCVGTEDRGGNLLRNVDNYLPVDAASCCRGSESSKEVCSVFTCDAGIRDVLG